MIRFILFDAGGTLLQPHPSVGDIYSDIALRHGVKADATLLNERFSTYWNKGKQNRRQIDKAWWRSVVYDVFTGSIFSDGKAFFEDLYASFENPSQWKVFPDVLPTLSELKIRGVTTAVASNWDERLPALLEKLGLAPYFDHQFISCRMGLVKPDPAFFQKALAEMNADPLETFHVGDDQEEDVRGAESAGLRAYLINRNQKPTNSRMLRSLDEILLRL